MSLALVRDIEAARRHQTPKADGLEHQEAFYQAAFALRDAISTTDLEPAYRKMFKACTSWWAYHERRILRLERTLHAALANDTLTDEQRQQILAGLHGSRLATVKDARLLTDIEATLIRRYRSMDPSDRQMLRTLLARLERAPLAATDAVPR